MAKLEFTQAEIEGYFKEYRHYFYKQTIERAEEIAVHADGHYPDKLLDERRPNESEAVLAYRRKIWKPKTKPTFIKVFNALQKIRRSQDWGINYPNNDDDFARIVDKETLEKYCEENFPGFTSITNWVFSVLLRKFLIDANAVVVCLPMDFDIAPNEYLKPVLNIFDSENVIDYVEEDYVVLQNPLGATFKDDKGNIHLGKSIVIINTVELLKYDQVNLKGDFVLTQQTPLGVDCLPAFKLRAVLTHHAMGHYMSESRIAGMLPELDEAVREYSDLQAAKVLHLFPERWEYTQNECRTCKGTGRIKNDKWKNGMPAEYQYSQCGSCEGHGYTVAGPYSKILVKPTKVVEGMSQVPLPPVGYAEKDSEIIKLMEQSVNNHLEAALSAINFDFINQSPIAQSGVAKSYDRDESKNVVHAIAEDIVWVMDKIYWMIARFRYGTLYAKDEIKRMLPLIPVPERFDMLSSDTLQNEIKVAKEAKQNPVILNAMETEFAVKRFNTDDLVRRYLQLTLELDPLPNISEDDKQSRLSNKGITRETYIISSNIQQFIRRAILEDQKFVDMEVQKQMEVMSRYAKEVEVTFSTAQTAISNDPFATEDTNVEDEIVDPRQQMEDELETNIE